MKVFEMKVICLVCSLMLVVSGSSAPLGSHSIKISEKEGKHFPIDESKLKNMMEASASRDKEKLFEEPLGFKPDRFRRHVTDFISRNKMLMPDDGYNFPSYSLRKNYESPLESLYDGLKGQDDNAMWSDNDDDQTDDGVWLNTIVRPRFEMPGTQRRSKTLDSIVKRIKARQSADLPSDYKNYLYY